MAYETTVTRDEDGVEVVRYWDVYEQRWQESAADAISDRTMATLPEHDREMVRAARARMA